MKKRERKAEERAAEERARRGPANMIPGFSIIKNSIITPLIMATEKVIEYTMPEHKIQAIEKEMEEAKQALPLEMRMGDLTIEEQEKKEMLERKRVRTRVDGSKASIVPDQLVDSAKDCVEFISDRTPIEKTEITSNFAMNLVELSDSALQKLAAKKKLAAPEVKEPFNMRFIKPSKKFYNTLMSVWVNIGADSLKSINYSQYLEKVVDRMGSKWSPTFEGPVRKFYSLAIEEYRQIKSAETQFDDSNYTQFFNSVKAKLLDAWNESVVVKMKESQ